LFYTQPFFCVQLHLVCACAFWSETSLVRVQGIYPCFRILFILFFYTHLSPLFLSISPNPYSHQFSHTLCYLLQGSLFVEACSLLLLFYACGASSHVLRTTR
jgi:hypothetical protein